MIAQNLSFSSLPRPFIQAHERLARLELMCPPLDDEMDASIDAEALEQAALPKQASFSRETGRE
jgi:hypothetical protein